MQCPMDPADVVTHITTVPSAGKGACTPAFVNHIRTPGRSRPEYPRYSIPLAGHALLGRPPGHRGGAA